MVPPSGPTVIHRECGIRFYAPHSRRTQIGHSRRAVPCRSVKSANLFRMAVNPLPQQSKIGRGPRFAYWFADADPAYELYYLLGFFHKPSQMATGLLEALRKRESPISRPEAALRLLLGSQVPKAKHGEVVELLCVAHKGINACPHVAQYVLWRGIRLLVEGAEHAVAAKHRAPVSASAITARSSTIMVVDDFERLSL